MNKDIETLQSIDVTTLLRYIEQLSKEDRARDEVRLLRWRNSGTMQDGEASALRLHVRALQKIVKTNAPKPKPVKELPLPDELPPVEVEKRWIAAAQKDVGAFYEYVSGKPLASHHKIWLSNIFSEDRKRINIIAPRDSAKSTIAVYALAYQIGSAPLSTSCLISVSEAQTMERLSMLRGIIATNIRFRNVFPHITIDLNKPDNANQFSVRVREEFMPYDEWRTLVEQKGSAKDPTVFATGYGGKGVIGRRFSGILLIDDIVDETMLTGDAQAKVYRYIMQTLIPCVKEEGKVVAIGTRWMVGDVPEMLMKNTRWHSIVIPAILYDKAGREFSYWPDYWPLWKLKERREEIGEMLFRIMYLCDPQASAIEIFNPELLNMDLPNPLPDFIHVYITTDFAISTKQTADWTVFQAVGEDKDGNFYLLDMARIKEDEKNSPTSLKLFANHVIFRYGRLDNILIESVAFSATMGTLLHHVAPNLPYLTVKPVGDKSHRARIVSDVSNRQQLFINQSMNPMHLEQLKKEWLNFGTHPHDDTLDPMGLLMQYLGVRSTMSATLSVVRSPFML